VPDEPVYTIDRFGSTFTMRPDGEWVVSAPPMRVAESHVVRLRGWRRLWAKLRRRPAAWQVIDHLEPL
jgi:hypothetical protein